MDFPAFDGTRLTDRIVGTRLLLICVPGGPDRAAVYLEELGGLDRQRALVLLNMRRTGESARPTALAGIATSIHSSSTGSPTATRPPRTTEESRASRPPIS
jgi:hypothetical protein